jgi:hypothetical protein
MLPTVKECINEMLSAKARANRSDRYLRRNHSGSIGILACASLSGERQRDANFSLCPEQLLSGNCASVSPAFARAGQTCLSARLYFEWARMLLFAPRTRNDLIRSKYNSSLICENLCNLRITLQLQRVVRRLHRFSQIRWKGFYVHNSLL